jgi:hypothetical protein
MRFAAMALATTSAVNVVVLASAIVPVVIAILVIRVAWIWARSHDEGWRLTFSELLRKAFWLDRRQSGTSG